MGVYVVVELIPVLVSLLLLLLIVGSICDQCSEWGLGCVDGEGEKSAIVQCEVRDGGGEMWCSDQGDPRVGLLGLASIIVLLSGTV